MADRSLFQNFFHTISNTNYREIHELTGCVNSALTDVAEELKLGKIMLDQNVSLFMSEYGFNVNDCVELKYSGIDDAVLKIAAWPCAMCSWNEAEREDVRFLLEMILVSGEREKLLHMVRHAETTDKLTGISNANGIIEHGVRLCRTPEKEHFGAFFVNLKNFKLINKRMTPKGGDIVLKQFAEYMQKLCEQDGERSARLGGDNFMMLVRSEHAAEVAEKLQQFQAVLYEGGQQLKIPVGVKAGYVLNLTEEHFPDNINKASIAMGIAKRSSEDVVAFEDSMMDKILKEKSISEKFNKALENKEFVVFYQPKVDAETLQICGAEALVRWLSQGEVISPGMFVPILEREGTITKLDYYMLETVCKHIRQWMQMKIEPTCVSVNFSKVHMKNPDTAKNIISIIQKNQIPPEYLEIELTEMSDFDDFITMKRFVAELKEAGIGVSMDDFGTGYSSLTLLRDLPVDTVKLDRSFVVNLESGNEKDRIMVQVITQMVKAFGMKVLIEGVETEEQYNYLKGVGCEVIQGYLFDKPMPLNTFNVKLTKMRSYNLEKA